MKRIITLLIAATILIAAAMMMSSCSQWADPFEQFDEDGKTVSVKYDAGEGVFVGRNGVTLIDVFSYDDVNVGGVKLLSPDDKQRGEGNAYTVSRQNHILGGWYIATTDSEGNTVPDLTKPWDFNTSKLDSRYLKDGITSAEPTLTLCAYWIPYTNFEIYVKGANGEFSKLTTVQTDSIRLPVWTNNGNLDLKDFPAVNGKTFSGAYLSSDLSEDSKITTEKYSIDVPKGETNPTVQIYATFDDGEWFRISTPDQIYKNAKVNGCYLIMNDIDFTNKIWPSAFRNNFNGKFVSNGDANYTISNISSQSAVGAESGAIFGKIGADAEFTNVSFSALSYKVNGTTKPANFALFASVIDAKATFENVTVSGTLTISNAFATDFISSINNYNFGIVSSEGNVSGITLGDAVAVFEYPEEITNGTTVIISASGTVEIIPA